MYRVHNIVSGELLDVQYTTKTWFCANQVLNVTADVTEVFQHLLAQGYVKMADSLDILRPTIEKGLQFLVHWVCFDKDKRTWERTENV